MHNAKLHDKWYETIIIPRLLENPFKERMSGAKTFVCDCLSFEAVPNPPLRLLDLGCGHGVISSEYAALGFEVTGTDHGTQPTSLKTKGSILPLDCLQYSGMKVMESAKIDLSTRLNSNKTRIWLDRDQILDEVKGHGFRVLEWRVSTSYRANDDFESVLSLVGQK